MWKKLQIDQIFMEVSFPSRYSNASIMNFYLTPNRVNLYHRKRYTTMSFNSSHKHFQMKMFQAIFMYYLVAKQRVVWVLNEPSAPSVFRLSIQVHVNVAATAKPNNNEICIEDILLTCYDRFFSRKLDARKIICVCTWNNISSAKFRHYRLVAKSFRQHGPRATEPTISAFI